ncbi:MAG: RNA polymerase sigma factor RpoH [Gammaproteobacteria bacterium]|jgi:RNA polymerase sigma-32 factor|nr:RNA polymerase sigma factor RpoH [Gammaproteobacteria bacterium]
MIQKKKGIGLGREDDTLSSLPAGPISSIEQYVQFVNSIPMLTETEEQALTKRLREEGDLDAAQTLILAHLRFVVSVARSFLGYGLSFSDLVQEGNIGLMKAVKRFDPEMGVRLVSFAVHWIKAEMHEFIIKNWRIVKVATTKPQRKLFFNLRSSHKRLGWMSKAEIAHIAQELKVKESDVIEMEKRMNSIDMQFDAPIEDESMDEHPIAPSLYLSAPESQNPDHQLMEDQTDAHQAQSLEDALESLAPRSQEIIKARWLTEPKATLHELAAHYQISAERIRQIEATAFKKLKRFLNPDQS